MTSIRGVFTSPHILRMAFTSLIFRSLFWKKRPQFHCVLNKKFCYNKEKDDLIFHFSVTPPHPNPQKQSKTKCAS